MVINDFGNACLAFDPLVSAARLHRSWSSERRQGNDVLEVFDVDFFSHFPKCVAGELEDACQVPGIENAKSLRVVQRIIQKPISGFAQQLDGMIENRQLDQAEQVDLQHVRLLGVALFALRRKRLPINCDVGQDRFGRYDDAGCMAAVVAWVAFDPLRDGELRELRQQPLAGLPCQRIGYAIVDARVAFIAILDRRRKFAYNVVVFRNSQRAAHFIDCRSRLVKRNRSQLGDVIHAVL